MTKTRIVPILLISFNVLAALKKAFVKKGVLVCHAHFFILNNIVFLTLKTYIRYKLEKKYIKKLNVITSLKKKNFKSINTLSRAFKPRLNTNLVSLIICPLNKNVNLFKVNIFFQKFKYIRRHLLKRRNDLFSDILNLSSLFIEKY